jgi:hypothetical protein
MRQPEDESILALGAIPALVSAAPYAETRPSQQHIKFEVTTD